ncbi:MAG TPA: hypothetical protein VF311_16060 [Terriglobales bacterium]|jgi:hypothetical protein
MTSKEIREHRCPMNVYVRRGSRAERAFRKRTGSPVPEAIAPGIAPTPEHDLKYQGGKTVQNLRFMNFYVGSDAWDQGDIASIDKGLSEAMSDQDLNNVMVQYFPGPITTNFDGSRTEPGSAPRLLSQGDVEQLVTTLYSGGKLTGHDLTSTVFNFMLPPGTVLNTDTTTTGGGQQVTAAVKRQGAAVKKRTIVPKDEDDSLNGLGGYHGSVHASGTDTVYYAVGVYSQTEANGTVNGIPVFDQPWKNVVATFYHELNEARTDADVEDAIRAGNSPNANSFLGWVSDQGEEVGDFPVSEAGGNLTEVFQEVELTDNSGTVPVQFMYSDAAHGPEGPIAQPNPPVSTLQRSA